MVVTLLLFPRKGNFIIKTNFQHKSIGKTVSAFYFGTEEVWNRGIGQFLTLIFPIRLIGVSSIFQGTVKFGYNDRPFLFVITGVRYNRANLCNKMTNLSLKSVCYNRVSLYLTLTLVIRKLNPCYRLQVLVLRSGIFQQLRYTDLEQVPKFWSCEIF